MKEISLIVQYITSGGRRLPHTDSGKLVEVIQDGKRRKPKTSKVETAYRWLIDNDWEPAGFRWLDKAGLVRRRKQTYRRQDT